MSTVAIPSVRRFLSFTLCGEDYGIEILKVMDIIQVVPITRMPRVPEYFLGLINLRGQVLPVIDLRKKFDISCDLTKEENKKASIIVVSAMTDEGALPFGLKVDSVNDVLVLKEDEVQDPPSRD